MTDDMANYRKFAVDLFRQRWFRELDPDYKTLCFYLHLEANNAGVFEIDPDSWNHFCHTGNRLKADDAFYRFGNRIQRVPKHPDKGIIVGLIDFQNNFGQNSNQFKWIQRDLEAVGLTYSEVQKMREHEEEQMELALEPQKTSERTTKELKNVIPPTVELVSSYCAERRNNVDAQQFVDFYESKGWKIGNAKMKDWQAAVRTWEKRHESRPAQSSVRPVQGQPVRKKF